MDLLRIICTLLFVLAGTAAPLLAMAAPPPREFLNWPVHLSVLSIASTFSLLAVRKLRLLLLLLVAVANCVILGFALFAVHGGPGALAGTYTIIGVMVVYFLGTLVLWSGGKRLLA